MNAVLRCSLLVVLFALPVAALAQADPDPPRPQVLVGFEIEADKFARNLPEQPAARSELARQLAAELALRYPFAEWIAGAPTPGNPPIGRLIARLVQTPAVPLPNVWVKWYGSVGEAAPAELPLPPVEIYSSGVVDRETNNRAAFVTHLSRRLMPTLRSDGFQQQFLRGVVQGLPIASAAEMRGTDRVVVIPRLWNHLRLGEETKLLLVFSRPSGTTVEEGTIRLVRPSQRTSQPRLGWLQAGVLEAAIGSTPLALERGWNERFQTLLDGAKVTCYIREYHPTAFPGAIGAVSLVSD